MRFNTSLVPKLSRLPINTVERHFHRDVDECGIYPLAVGVLVYAPARGDEGKKCENVFSPAGEVHKVHKVRVIWC